MNLLKSAFEYIRLPKWRIEEYFKPFFNPPKDLITELQERMKVAGVNLNDRRAVQKFVRDSCRCKVSEKIIGGYNLEFKQPHANQRGPTKTTGKFT